MTKADLQKVLNVAFEVALAASAGHPIAQIVVEGVQKVANAEIDVIADKLGIK